jgi:hypothetical protein
MQASLGAHSSHSIAVDDSPMSYLGADFVCISRPLLWSQSAESRNERFKRKIHNYVSFRFVTFVSTLISHAQQLLLSIAISRAGHDDRLLIYKTRRRCRGIVLGGAFFSASLLHIFGFFFHLLGRSHDFGIPLAFCFACRLPSPLDISIHTCAHRLSVLLIDYHFSKRKKRVSPGQKKNAAKTWSGLIIYLPSSARPRQSGNIGNNSF